MRSAIIHTLLGVAILAQSSVAHPGDTPEQHARDIAERRSYLSTHKRDLAHCSEKLKARGNDLVMHARREAAVEKLRAKRAIKASRSYLKARDAASVLKTLHLSNLTGITVETDPSTLFSGNNSCILSPEVTQGPYYVSGELVREDMSEDQEGVPLALNFQIIDVNTCEPVPQVYLEAWHCNSTGVYSGIIANGNGDNSDATNLNNTFLRGIQQSDESGVVTIQSTFPGHYVGRAPHIHVLSHSTNVTLLANNTISGNTATHVGQVFFDQDLITLVETQEPYTSNTQELTTNADDQIFSEEAATSDPVVEYVLLGDDISEGLFAWLTFGVDTTFAFNVTPAATLTENGGVANEHSGRPGGPGGNGTFPPGTTPHLRK